MIAVWSFLGVAIVLHGINEMTVSSNASLLSPAVPPSAASDVPLTRNPSREKSWKRRRAADQEATTRPAWLVPSYTFPDPVSLLCLDPLTGRRLDSCVAGAGAGTRCGEYALTPTLPQMAVCSCRTDCAVYNDCCADFWETCPQDPSLEDRAGTRSCLHPESEPVGFLATTRCPRNWTDNRTRSRCEDNDGASFHEVAVAIGPNDEFYQNVYCAICHGLTQSDVYLSSFMWRCPDGTHVLLQNTNNVSAVVSSVKAIPQCKIQPVIPPAFQHARVDCVDYIDRCPAATESQSLVELCRNHTAKVVVLPDRYVPVSRAYGNVHCAICNDPYTVQKIDTDSVRCGHFAGRIPTRVPSFDILFDFDAQGNYNIQCVATNRVLFNVTSQFTCDEGEMFDILLEKCVSKEAIPAQLPGESRRQWSGALNGSLSDVQVLMTLRIEFAPAYSFVGVGKLETEAEYFVRSLLLNLSRNVREVEFDMASHSATTLVVSSSYLVVIDSVAMEKLLQHTCVEAWRDAVYARWQQGVRLVHFSLRRTGNDSCQGGQEEVVIHRDVRCDYRSRNISSSSNGSANNWLQSQNMLNSKSCYYNLTGPDSACVETELGSCAAVNETAGDRLDCPGGVVLKLGKGMFRITDAPDEHLVFGSLRYPPERYLLTRDGLHAFVCHFSKVSLVWNAVSKTSIKQTLSFAGSLVSIVSLLVTIVTMLLVKSMRSRPGKLIMNLAASLMVAQLMFITVMDLTKLPLVCRASAVFSHYIWLVAFCWMSAVSFDLAYMTRKSTMVTNDSDITWHCLYAWLVPLVFVGACALVDVFAPRDWQIGYSEGMVCWIGRLTPFIAVFLVPVGLIMAFNFSCFVYTVVALIRSDIRMSKYRSKSYTTRHFVFSIQMSTIMGLAWILGIADSFVQSDALDYVFITVNSVQGLSIFVVFLLRPRTFGLVRDACWKVFLRTTQP